MLYRRTSLTDSPKITFGELQEAAKCMLRYIEDVLAGNDFYNYDSMKLGDERPTVENGRIRIGYAEDTATKPMSHFFSPEFLEQHGRDEVPAGLLKTTLPMIEFDLGEGVDSNLGEALGEYRLSAQTKINLKEDTRISNQLHQVTAAGEPKAVEEDAGKRISVLRIEGLDSILKVKQRYQEGLVVTPTEPRMGAGRAAGSWAARTGVAPQAGVVSRAQRLRASQERRAKAQAEGKGAGSEVPPL